MFLRAIGGFVVARMLWRFTRRAALLLLLVAVAGGGCKAVTQALTAPPTAATGGYRGALPHHAVLLAAVGRTSGCHVITGDLPDPRCTPGAIFADASVSTICSPGYSKRVRNVSYDEKSAVYAAYGSTRHYNGRDGELDHLVPLSLGGANGVGVNGSVSSAQPAANLWPEDRAAPGGNGFQLKDDVELFARHLVCDEGFPLLRAQRMIAGNWMQFVATYGRQRVMSYAYRG